MKKVINARIIVKPEAIEQFSCFSESNGLRKAIQNKDV